MHDDQEFEGAQPSIEEPDLDNIEPWLEKYVTEPMKGYEAKKYADGTPYSAEEILEEARNQFRFMLQDRTNLETTNKKRREMGVEPLTAAENDAWIKRVFVGIASIK